MAWALLILIGCQGAKVVGESAPVETSIPDDSAPVDDSPHDDSSPGDDSGPDDSAPPCPSLVAVASASHDTGRLPLDLELDGSGSCGPLPIVDWAWSAAGDSLDGERVDWTALVAGEVEVTLTVTDEAGDTASTTIDIEVESDVCPTAGTAENLGDLADDALVESSGLLVSRRDPDVLWTHNDSGDTARLFALGRDGSALGTWTLDVADGDWEDLAWGTDPDTGEPLLFAGDIGDFGTTRSTVVVYVLDEPEVDTAAEPTSHTVESWRTLTLHLPEALNMDSMLVDPDTGDLYLLSDAEDGRSVLLRKAAPHLDGDDVTLEEVGEFRFGADPLPGDTLATGADISPLGDRVVVRTRDEAWMWLRDASQTVAEAMTSDPCPITLPTQTLGEAITFDIRDGGLLVSSEGAHEPLWHVPLDEQPECYDHFEAVITATPPGGPLPVDVVFDTSGSCVPEGLASARWQIAGQTLLGESVTTSWLASGSYPVSLILTDTTGAHAYASTTLEIEPGDCPYDDGYETLGTVADADLLETSGVAVGRRDPAVLWVHNDSGHDSILYAIDRSGALLGTWTLDVEGDDLEDMAAGYADDGTPELWLGDVGDNRLERTEIKLYRLEEPEVDTGGVAEDHDVTDLETLTLTYPDGAHNCETVMEDPVTGDLYLLTKEIDGASELFRKAAPHTDGETAELEYITTLNFGTGALAGNKLVTGGDFSPDGAWIVVRTYADTAFVWPRDRSATVADAFAADPCTLTLPTEPQGEAICFDADADGLITISEGESPPIYRTLLAR